MKIRKRIGQEKRIKRRLKKIRKEIKKKIWKKIQKKKEEDQEKRGLDLRRASRPVMMSVDKFLRREYSSTEENLSFV